MYWGAVISTEKRSIDHPRVTFPSGSSAAFSMPHPVTWSRAHSAPWRSVGDPVSRGPYTSEIQLIVSIAWERLKVSDLICATFVSFTASWARTSIGENGTNTTVSQRAVRTRLFMRRVYVGAPRLPEI